MARQSPVESLDTFARQLGNVALVLGDAKESRKHTPRVTTIAIGDGDVVRC